jgi:hypothetical protein
VRRLKAAVLFLILSVWYNHTMPKTKTIRKKRGDTLVKTIEKKYGVDLGYRSDAQLHTVLKKEGLPSLSKLLKMTKKS